jgi:hypothetical protein
MADRITVKDAAKLAGRLESATHTPDECRQAGRVITAMLRQFHMSDVLTLPDEKS